LGSSINARHLQRRASPGQGREDEFNNNQCNQAIAAVLFFAVLIIPSLDYGFRGSTVPRAIMALGHVLLVFSLAIIFFVFKENSYAAGTIKVETEQRVISTGPYRMVRHPMYSGALILFLATPLALGSVWGRPSRASRFQPP
jgi:protein-S-isoprenylcysteine O-methyltransferase Ste14